MTESATNHHYRSWGECPSHKTKHFATISTGTTPYTDKKNIADLRATLAEDLDEEYPWCISRGMKIKFVEYKIPEVAKT